MSDLERDHVLRRAVQTLRQLPTPREDAIGRVVAAAAAQRVMPAADDPAVEASPSARSGQRRWRNAGFGALVAAAAIVGFVVRGPITRTPPTASVASKPAPDAPPLRAAVNGASDVLPVPQQFVFRSASAHRVSVVGDFNRWNSSSAPMARAAGGDLWSITIPIVPGRHTYGFMVDDSIFALDPDSRVARARDPDLGAEGSVVMVRP
jgi:hypothetical protein